MLTGTDARAPQRPLGAAFARPERAAPKQDGGSDAAQAFRDKLQALSKDKSEAPRGLRKRELYGAEDLALAAPRMEAPANKPLRGEQDAHGKLESAAAPSSQPREQSAVSSPADIAGGGPGDPTSASLAGKFAERLALPSQALAETHVQLDTTRYLVGSVTVSGRSDEGMSLSYHGGSADGEGARQDEEALRQRLEARGLKVAVIHAER